MRSFVLIFALALGTLLGACSASKDTKLAEQAVVRFHKLLDAGDSAAIYASTSKQMKATASQEDFVKLLDTFHRKLGKSGEATQTGWNVNYGTGGSIISLTYKTAYASGPAEEEFMYRLSGKEALLEGYHVNSNALVLN